MVEKFWHLLPVSAFLDNLNLNIFLQETLGYILFFYYIFYFILYYIFYF